MKLVQIDGDKFRILVMFNEGDYQPDFVKFRGKKFHKAAEIKLKSSEKKVWNQGFIYIRNKWEK